MNKRMKKHIFLIRWFGDKYAQRNLELIRNSAIFGIPVAARNSFSRKTLERNSGQTTGKQHNIKIILFSFEFFALCILIVTVMNESLPCWHLL
jgi:hypothetical protein